MDDAQKKMIEVENELNTLVQRWSDEVASAGLPTVVPTLAAAYILGMGMGFFAEDGMLNHVLMVKISDCMLQGMERTDPVKKSRKRSTKPTKAAAVKAVEEMLRNAQQT